MSDFAGTAAFYTEFRAGYPRELWDSLAVQAGLDAGSRVLELGCGPGTATFGFAHHCGTVVAVDADEEMVNEGRRRGDELGINNIEWLNSPAEQVHYPDGSFQLIVIASAFHWMDRPAVGASCRTMLNGTGVLAVLGNPTPLMQIREGTAIGAAIAAVQDRWFGDEYYVLDIDELERPETVLRRCGFSEVEVVHVPQVQHWTVDRFVGFLRSTSSRPDQRLGADFIRFADEVADAIRAVEPTGRWTLEIPVEMICCRP